MSNKDSILKEILKWSEDKPLWQRDALRRLIENDDITGTDLDELTHICKAIHDNEMDQTLVANAEPLSNTHIPVQIPGVTKVSLNSISDTENINALAKEQTLNLFGDDKGIVVIYGDNASGKSGYGRIIKRSCRARNRGKAIKPNIFLSGQTGKAKASIAIKVDGQDDTVNWVDSEADKGELSYISFFDSECALSHVNNSNDIAFTPFGLDLLEKLAHVARKIHTFLDAEKGNLTKQKPEVLKNPPVHNRSMVENILRQLSFNSDIAEIKSSITLSEEEIRRLEQLRSDLAQDPNKLLAQLQIKLDNIRRLASHYRGTTLEISDERCAEYKNICQDARTKTQAAKVVAESLFKNEPLPVVGNEIWRSLWESARKYSEECAYQGLEFPVTEDARCVFCQQPLSPEAAARLKKFETFVKDNAQKTAEDASKIMSTTIQSVKNLTFYSRQIKDLLREIKIDDEELFISLRKTTLSSELRKRKLLRAFHGNDWITLNQLYAIPNDGLDKYINSIEFRINEINKILKSEDRKKLEEEKNGLEDRCWAVSIFDDIEQEIQRLGKVEKIDKAIADTVTTSITVKSRQLAEEFVTNRLRDRFAGELDRLSITSVHVELVRVGGEYGSTIYQIRLIAAPQENLKDILSEGEFRCIALAGFLTELATDDSGSGVVFDDPVSSLDHKWREKVAERLVQESAKRQVIIFTHDIVFLHDLLDYAESQKVNSHVQRVYQSSAGYGTIGSELPWKVQNTLQRLDILGKALGEAKQKFDAHETDAYEKECTDIYTELRATVERTIEEHVFNRVVVRHRDYVNVKELEKVKVIQSSDIDSLLDIHKRCCDVTRAHDPSSGRNASAPNPTEVKTDIEKLDTLVRSIKERKK